MYFNKVFSCGNENHKYGFCLYFLKQNLRKYIYSLYWFIDILFQNMYLLISETQNKESYKNKDSSRLLYYFSF